jgi:regulator of protease activity HflC (stomatin/prohibitin superfamily)
MKKKARNIGLLLFTYALLAAVVILVFFDRMVITVPSGHVGVFYSRLFGGTDTRHIYGEGLHIILPWDSIYLYDCRSQKADYDVSVLVEGGLVVVVHSSIIWNVLPDSAPQLHVSVGPEYRDKLIAPAMTSGIRSAGGLQPDLYSANFNAYAFEEDILAYVQQFINNGAFNFDAVLIREIELPKEVLAAINRKFAAEQSVLERRYKVQEAYEGFRERYIEAEGQRVAALILNSGLTENFLRYQGIEATRKLAESNNAKLVIIGDKDGLPLLLNPDALSVNPDTAAAPGISADPVQPALEFDSLSQLLGQAQERLDTIGPVPPFESGTLPQASGTQRVEGER